MENIPPKYGAAKAEICGKQYNAIALAIILAADIKPFPLGLRSPKVIHHGLMGKCHFVAIGTDAQAYPRIFPHAGNARVNLREPA